MEQGAFIHHIFLLSALLACIDGWEEAKPLLETS